MCLPECPNEAIFEGQKVYEIDVARCTECVGFYEYQTCMAVCPIDCIEVHPEHIESKAVLEEKFKALNII
jgi:Fe-S-cluster-containing hydrogenase component 2